MGCSLILNWTRFRVMDSERSTNGVQLRRVARERQTTISGLWKTWEDHFWTRSMRLITQSALHQPHRLCKPRLVSLLPVLERAGMKREHHLVECRVFGR